MNNVTQLTVSISIGDIETEVGEMVRDGRKIYFKYYPDFIETGYQISPFMMP